MSLSFGVLLLGRAVQVSSEVIPETSGQKTASSSAPALTPLPVDADGNCLSGDTYKALSADLKFLDQRQKEIALREKSLAAIETRLSGQLATAEKANSKLQSKIDSLKTIANDDLKHLVDMYETMKPKQAAEIFNSMDPAFAAGFLREMKSGNAGLVMANMDAKKSYTISVFMASRNAEYR